MVKIEIDLSVKCRSCLLEEQEMHNLFVEFDQGLSLSDILKSTTLFQVKEDDGLSPSLCENCTNIIVDFYNFKSIYQENDRYIKSLLEAQGLKNVVVVTVDDKNIKSETEEFKIEVVDADEEESEYNHEQSEYTSKIMQNVGKHTYDYIQENKVLEEVTGVYVETEGAVSSTQQFSDNPEEQVQDINSTRYTCLECGDLFLSKSNIQEHLLLKHKISILESEKYVSELVTTIPKELKLEINVENSLQYDICNDNFNETHTKLEEYSDYKKYICEHCGSAFAKKSYLDDHAEMHTAEKRHICPICKKAFRRRTVLVKHKRIHTHPRQWICEVCGLRFNDKGTLKTHIKLKHIKERTFNCTICGLWFPLKSTLDKHTFRHNMNRKNEFACSVCSSSYKDKSSLNRHMLIKHAENAKKVVCVFCGKQYTTKTSLLKHMRKHHKVLGVAEKLQDVKELL